MKCPKCNFENKANAEYCSNCGQNLSGISKKINKKNKFKFMLWGLLIVFLVGATVGTYIYISNTKNDSSKTDSISKKVITKQPIEYSKLSSSNRGKVNFDVTGVNNKLGIADPIYDLKIKITNKSDSIVKFDLSKFKITGEVSDGSIKSSSDGVIKIKPQTSYTVKKMFSNIGEQNLVGDIELDYISSDYKAYDMKNIHYSEENTQSESSYSNDDQDNSITSSNSDDIKIDNYQEAIDAVKNGPANGITATWSIMGNSNGSDYNINNDGEIYYWVRGKANLDPKTGMGGDRYDYYVYEDGTVTPRNDYES